MIEISILKAPNGVMVPLNDLEKSKVEAFKAGEVYTGKFVKMRNGPFFRKWWDLVNFAFENWEPPNVENLEYKGQPVQKSMERFRKEVTILAGHFDVTVDYKGSIRKEAKSISFASMSEDEFARFFSATIDAILLHFLNGYDRETLERVLSYC